MFRMDPETRQLFQKLTDLAEENNKILHKMQSRARWTMFFSTMKWILFVGVLVGSYFAVAPYLDQTVSVYKNIESQASGHSISDYLKNFGNSVKSTITK